MADPRAIPDQTAPSWDERVSAVVDEAHAENLGGKHREGFCEACADAHLVAQRAVPGGPGSLSLDEYSTKEDR